MILNSNCDLYKFYNKNLDTINSRCQEDMQDRQARKSAINIGDKVLKFATNLLTSSS